ncbi:hypothetical protein PUR57_12600 [Streptomyces sp. JV176]|uniref:hypothetical protein n=1 Tax=Streptomyces sp. JV176 TaxID=858630 RepID=UPI002E7A00B8|nr:hypothetical protein [Streptomyces sp. JV176]MEE1799502.1 hypothetical protein [Streptomyces sp. JV176]
MTSDGASTLEAGSERVAETLQRVRRAREKAVSWLSERVADDGRPEGAETANAWWRAPWALSVGGADDVAAAMLGWIERNALTDDGDLRPEPYGGGLPRCPVYQLSPIAIGAWLLGRYSTATIIMDKLQQWTDPVHGGAWDFVDHDADPLQDSLRTGQLGISALVTGRTSMADGVRHWFGALWDAQPEAGRLYTGMRNGKLVTEFSPEETFTRVVDYRAPKQTYFHSGIAGAFLAGYAGQASDPAAIELGLQYLRLNETGTKEQFEDTTSVQICKYGWGAAAMHAAAPDSGQLPWVLRMADWFVTRQRHDGTWAPSSFMVPEPGLLDYYWKTAEHLMELAYIEHALISTRRAPVKPSEAVR